MTANSAPNLPTSVVNQVLAIKPLWNFAKGRARTMMVKRAESLGVPWRETVQGLETRKADQGFSPEWETELAAIQNPNLTYPDYYTTSFHAYDEGNLGWRPAMEVEVAAKAVHARIWPETGAAGDARLRQSYHDVLQARLPEAPKDIVDLGCGVGMSTETLQATFPAARLTGVDLSPYFLAVAKYREQACRNAGKPGSRGAGEPSFLEDKELSTQRLNSPPGSLPVSRSPLSPCSTIWHHAPAEATGLPAASCDLVSICLVFHELPQSAAKAIIQEAHRLLRPGGHLAIMDMNPESEFLKTIPAFVFTLLKSTEPYLDEYFSLNLNKAFCATGFDNPSVDFNSPRHRTVIGRKPRVGAA
jgi:ubiquinone/menaquinone biosynthesis C-methylase UbiE